MRMVNKKITIRPEEHKDYKSIVSLILRSFQEGTDYSDGTDIIALVEEIRDSKYYIPELSFVAELDNQVVGHFLFSKFPLSPARDGGHGDGADSEIVMLAPVSVHADYFRQGIGTAMLRDHRSGPENRNERNLPLERPDRLSVPVGAVRRVCEAGAKRYVFCLHVL